MTFQLTRYTFGESISLAPRKTGPGVGYYLGTKYWLLDEARVELKSEDLGSSYALEPERGPFERADFGDRERLSWAAGATSMETDAQLTFWRKRFALWFEGATLCAVDATRPLAVRLALPIATEKISKSLCHDGVLYLGTSRSLIVVSATAVEALFDQPSGMQIVHAKEIYPLRRPEAKQVLQVDWVWSERVHLRTEMGGWSPLTIPYVPGLVAGDLVTLYNMLATDQYLELSINKGERRPLYDREFPAEHGGSYRLEVEPCVDPAGTLVRGSTAVRGEDLDRMFGLLADEPDDAASRMVIVDLLEEAGEPYAPLFAKLLGGDESVRGDALGTLTNYLDDLEWHDNFPRAGTLAEAAPLDEDIGAIVMSDHRLGFFHTLRLGAGNFKLYAKLVAAPRAVGLRHVDGSRAQTLKALIAAGRTTITRLFGVKFVSREVIEALADPTFDRVVEIETETAASSVDRLLDYITRDEAKFFARAPRHLELVERNGDDELLVTAVLAAWPTLPLAKLTFAGITLSRDGTAIARDASEAVRAIVATKFRLDVARADADAGKAAR